MQIPQIISGKIEHPRQDAAALIWRWLRTVLHTLWLWHERARQRRQLQLLSEHTLRDLGLSRYDVEAETAKPFWRS